VYFVDTILLPPQALISMAIYRSSWASLAAALIRLQQFGIKLFCPASRFGIKTGIGGTEKGKHARQLGNTMAQPNIAVRETNGARVAPPPGAAIVDFGPLANWIGFHLRLAQNASFQAFTREASGIDLRPGRFATLMIIGRNPGISQTALSRANARDKSSLTPVLNDLVRRKLVKRVRAKDDRRSYRLMLTSAGEELLDKLTACAARHEQHLDEVLGPIDRARFLQILKRLIAEIPANGNDHSR
jgi:DNA-binding MarR family transcriptional regulator